MRFKLFFLVALSIYSCTNSDKEAISLFNFLPTDSTVIISINDLNNTKEILNNNRLLPIVLSTSKEIYNQLGLLSNNNSDRKGLFSLSTYGKNEIAFTYIRKSNSFDTVLEGDTLKNKYQKSEIFSSKVTIVRTPYPPPHTYCTSITLRADKLLSFQSLLYESLLFELTSC